MFCTPDIKTYIQGFILFFLLFCTSYSLVAQQTYSDTFSSVSYSNNDGTQNWLTDWIEVDDTDLGPSDEYIYIGSNRLNFYWLWYETITRSVDLDGADTATLSFDWGISAVSPNRSLIVEISNGGGYTTLATITGSTTTVFSQDISSYISSNTSIRFRRSGSLSNNSGNWGNDDYGWVDNVLITTTTLPLVDQPPVVTATGDQDYCEGQLPIVESISITDPDDTTTDAVYVQISSGYQNGEDVLTYIGGNPSITATWNAAEGKLDLVANSGPITYTAFETALQQVVYSRTSSTAPAITTRQFSITVGDANYLPSTGHYYEFVSQPGITWTDAKTAAEGRTHFGLQGYLATITSQEEADFSGEQTTGTGWIGATDEAVENEWRWVTGPEAGTQFWQGLANGSTTVPYNFAFWNGGEPNNSGGEDYAHIVHPNINTNGSWNDLPNGGGGGNYASQGYVVEYGGMSGDPSLQITAVTTISLDDEQPTWDTAAGALDQSYQCADDVPSLAACPALGVNYFNEAQYSWGVGVQNNTATAVDNWELIIENADYQLEYGQLSNQSRFTLYEKDNGDGTYDLIFRGLDAVAAYSSINIAWTGVDFGYDPSSTAQNFYCSDTPLFQPPIASDNCSTAVVELISDVTVPDSNSNDYVRTMTYQAHDALGNLSSPYTVTITVNDTTNPTADPLAAINVEGSANVPAPDPSIVTGVSDNCTANPVVTFTSDSSDGGSNPETITRTYQVADESDNIIFVQQTIRVFPQTVITNRNITYRVN